MTKYLVVGSPGRYRLQAVRPGGKDYESGMSEEAAENTRVALNEKYFKDKKKEPPKSNDTNNSGGSNEDFVETITATASGKIRTLTAEEYEEFKKIPIEEKLDKIAELAASNIRFRDSQKEDLERTFRIKGKDFDEAMARGLAGEVEVIESGPLNSGVNTWWQLIGYESLDEANRDLASGALTIAEITRAKDNAEEKRTGGAIDNTTQSTYGPQEFGDIITTVTVYKDGKTLEVLESDLHLYEASNWTRDIDKDTPSTSTPSTSTPSTSTPSEEEEETIGSTQVVVYGPNGARTTANTFKRPGEEMSEYDRLIAGLIPGREGYAGATESEPLTADYPGDYGGEDASTPMDQRESVVGIGNTDYDNKDYSSVGQVVGQSSANVVPQEQTLNPNKNQFNNIPEGADLVDVEGQLFLRYAVPGAGELYQGSTLFMFYEVKDNDPVEAGFVTPGQDWFVNAKFSFDDLDLMGVIAGNSADLPGNDPITDKAPHPFTSFAENLATEAQIAPWILDPDSVALIAEAALEGREVTEAEWFSTNWYKTRNESERSWLREYTKDPLTAKQKANDYKLQVAAALKASGVSGGYDSETNQELGAPDALSSYIANQWVSGQWSESYTTEQLALFADPFRTGVRDQDFTDWIDTAGVGGLNRSAEQEDRIRSLYTQWLGPVFGQLTDSEVSEKAGRLRNNPDYEAALVENLKTSRLALFPKHTNTELTYDDIVSPYRGITRQIWGKEADETEGWWQDMVATNDYEASQTLLREKGLEQNIGQVTVAATEALQQALGASAGSVEENLGVNQ